MKTFLDDVNTEEVKTQVEAKISEIIDILRLKEVVPLEHIGETPKRIAKMYVDELFASCYSAPPSMKLFTPEKGQSSGVTPVLSENIGIHSCCSHHGVPFYGKASIYYVPKNKRITGLSKFYRVCEYFGRRPQVQENLTTQIGEYIFKELDPHQLIVVLKCEHMCVSQRGAKAHNPLTTTYWSKSDSEYPVTWDQIKFVMETIK